MNKKTFRQELEQEAISKMHRQFAKLAEQRKFKASPILIESCGIYYYRSDYAQIKEKYSDFIVSEYDARFALLLRYFPNHVVSNTRVFLRSGFLSPVDIIPFMICACGYDDLTRSEMLLNL